MKESEIVLRNRVRKLEQFLSALIIDASPSAVRSFGEKNVLIRESLIQEARELLEKTE